MDPEQLRQLQQLQQFYQQRPPPRMLDESIDPPPAVASPEIFGDQYGMPVMPGPAQQNMRMREVDPYQEQRPWDPQRRLYRGA
jgi:hypothetical protein